MGAKHALDRLVLGVRRTHEPAEYVKLRFYGFNTAEMYKPIIHSSIWDHAGMFITLSIRS